MGRRSWFTVVESEYDWRGFVEALRTNPDSDGIVYVAKVKDTCFPDFAGRVVVAWQGDGNGSLYEEMPQQFHHRTWLLDRSWHHYRDWKGHEEELIERYFTQGEQIEEYFEHERRNDAS